jgi:cell division protein FtsX
VRYYAVTVFLLAASVVAGCGANSERGTTPSASSVPTATAAVIAADSACRLVIYVAKGSRENVMRVQTYLGSDAAVADFEFVTAEEQLDEFRKDNPDLVEALSENPLPHKFTARLGPSVHAQDVVARYRALHLPGVVNVRYQRDDGVCQ